MLRFIQHGNDVRNYTKKKSISMHKMDFNSALKAKYLNRKKSILLKYT